MYFHFFNSDTIKPERVKTIPMIKSIDTGSFNISDDKKTVTTGIKYI